VDLVRYAFRAEPSPEERIFFVGDLSWPPNAEGIRWFCEEIWPLVARLSPSSRVEVLGRGAGAGLSMLMQNPPARVAFLGEGDDTRPHWGRAAVAIVPLLGGGGTRLKILEAAACGVPVVSTPLGAEGLDFTEGEEILLAAGAEEFADAVARLLADADARRSQAAAARRRVERQYGWNEIGRRFARELAALA
jgi:glycosyltransferase involved in cell wall biosynthesis